MKSFGDNKTVGKYFTRIGILLLVAGVVSKYLDSQIGNIILFPNNMGYAMYLDSLLIFLGLLSIVLGFVPSFFILILGIAAIYFAVMAYITDYRFVFISIGLVSLGMIFMKIYRATFNPKDIVCGECYGKGTLYFDNTPCHECNGTGEYHK